MNPSASAFVGLICLAIVAAGFLWQYHLWRIRSPLKIYELKNRWDRFRSPLEISKEVTLKPYFQIREFLRITSALRQKRAALVRMGSQINLRLMKVEEKKTLGEIQELERKIPPMREEVRIVAAVSICLCLIIGSFAFSLFQIIDRDAPVSPYTSLTIFVAMTIFSVLFSLKTYFSPIILSCTASWALYSWFQHGSLEILPLFNLAVERLLSWAPHWVADTYLYTYIIYSTASLTWSEWGFDASWLKSLFGDG